MAAGDALLGQRGLHGRNGGRENVRLLKHLRGMWPIQRAEHSAVVQLHPLVQLDYRELVPAGLGAPVFILRSQTEAAYASSSEITWSSPVFPFHMPQLVSAFSAQSQMSILGHVSPAAASSQHYSYCYRARRSKTAKDTHHHPVFRMYNMHRASGLSLNGLVDDATSHAIDQNDPDEATLLMQVCALRHHSQQIGVQVLQERRWQRLIKAELLCSEAKLCIQAHVPFYLQNIKSIWIFWH